MHLQPCRYLLLHIFMKFNKTHLMGLKKNAFQFNLIYRLAGPELGIIAPYIGKIFLSCLILRMLRNSSWVNCTLNHRLLTLISSAPYLCSILNHLTYLSLLYFIKPQILIEMLNLEYRFTVAGSRFFQVVFECFIYQHIFKAI